MRFKCITKESGSIYKSRERVDSKLMEMEAPSDGLLPQMCGIENRKKREKPIHWLLLEHAPFVGQSIDNFA